MSLEGGARLGIRGVHHRRERIDVAETLRLVRRYARSGGLSDHRLFAAARRATELRRSRVVTAGTSLTALSSSCESGRWNLRVTDRGAAGRWAVRFATELNYPTALVSFGRTRNGTSSQCQQALVGLNASHKACRPGSWSTTVSRASSLVPAYGFATVARKRPWSRPALCRAIGSDSGSVSEVPPSRPGFSAHQAAIPSGQGKRGLSLFPV